MSLYLCRWPDGDLTIATGKHILPLLDEIDDPSIVHAIPINSMAIHFELNDQGDLEFAGFNEEFVTYLGKALPKILEVKSPVVSDQDDEPLPEKILTVAVKKERGRQVSYNLLKVLDRRREKEIGL